MVYTARSSHPAPGPPPSLPAPAPSHRSALCFAHPQAKYFAVGAINKDQVESYSARKGDTLDVTERWLAPLLNYDTGDGDGGESKEA